MLPAAPSPACHGYSLAICLRMATPGPGPESGRSLLQSSLPSSTKRATRASPTVFDVKQPATFAPSRQPRQRSHEVTSHTFARLLYCMASNGSHFLYS